MDELKQYKEQLALVQQQLELSPGSSENVNLLQLEKDLKELIALVDSSNEPEPDNDPFKDEYALFRESVGLNEDADKGNDSEEEEKAQQLQNDLESLCGTKCRAPFKHAWTNDVVYHNALVYKLETNCDLFTSDDICVRVMFTNPTHQDMVPCPYYLDGDCKFEDEKCRFSHGELARLNSLQDYEDPDFTQLREGSHVLVKREDRIWHRATIVSIQDDTCCVKLESVSDEIETHLQNVHPLAATNEAEMESDDSNDVPSREQEETSEVIRRIFNSEPCGHLGSWEQHTTGIGSRIMAKMGYIHGSGLGSQGQGRVDPVPALVYPAGKSLDHCLMLKEKAGAGNDLFKAERKAKRQQYKHEKALSKAYEKEKLRTDVFTFLNEKLNTTDSNSPASTSGQSELRRESHHGLNVSGFQLAEDIKKTEKEVKTLNDSLARHLSGSPAHNTLKEKLQACESKLHQLHTSEKKITTELQQRKDRKKLAVF